MQNIKRKAIEILKVNKIHKLPISLDKLLKLNHWELYKYSEAEPFFQKTGLLDYAATKKGFCYYSENDEVYNIFISDGLGYTEKKLTIAHEIGHIVMGHSSIEGVLGKSENLEEENIQEKEANTFALALLAPAPLLIKNKAYTRHDIERKADINKKAAAKVAAQIEEELPRYMQQRLKKVAKILTISVSALILSLAFGAFVYISNNYIKDSKPEEEQKTFAVDKAVAITPAGDKFHELDCRYVKDKDITELTVAEAQEQGKDPCKVCEPLE